MPMNKNHEACTGLLAPCGIVNSTSRTATPILPRRPQNPLTSVAPITTIQYEPACDPINVLLRDRKVYFYTAVVLSADITHLPTEALRNFIEIFLIYSSPTGNHVYAPHSIRALQRPHDGPTIWACTVLQPVRKVSELS